MTAQSAAPRRTIMTTFTSDTDNTITALAPFSPTDGRSMSQQEFAGSVRSQGDFLDSNIFELLTEIRENVTLGVSF
jgi:hypothetical protein